MKAMRDFPLQAWGVFAAETRKLVREPTELLTRSLQPLLWLLVFGQVFARARVIESGSIGYLAFLAPGILAQSVLFTAIFYGIGVIWDRDSGILQKQLVSPAWRPALVLGRAGTAGVRGLAQAAVVIVVAVLLGIRLRASPLGYLSVGCFVVLSAGVFSTLSLAIACLVKTRERFMGIGQVLTMPLFFASNAVYPIAMMPHWLQQIARLNPLTYLVDALRTLLVGAPSVIGLPTDAIVLAISFLVLLALTARLLPTIIW